MRVEEEKTKSCLVSHRFSTGKKEKLNNLYNFVLGKRFLKPK